MQWQTPSNEAYKVAQQAVLGSIFKNTIEKQSAGTPFLDSILDPGVKKCIFFVPNIN